MPKFPSGLPNIPDGLTQKLKDEYNPFMPEEPISKMTSALTGFGNWEPSHLSTNPYPQETPEWEKWGWFFLALIDRYHLTLPIPTSDPLPKGGDTWVVMFTRYYWWGRRTFGNLSYALPFWYWPPEWSKRGATHGYQVFTPQFEAGTTSPFLLNQRNPFYQFDSWGMRADLPQPSLNALLWQVEYDHALRNNWASYQNPYGPGVWLRREGKPFEVFKPVWNAQYLKWDDPTPDNDRVLQSGIGQKWWDEWQRWQHYGGPGMTEHYDERVYGPLPAPRLPFPQSAKEMEDVLSSVPPIPIPPEPGETSLYENIITHGQKVADFGDAEVWVFVGRAYLVVNSTRTVIPAEG